MRTTGTRRSKTVTSGSANVILNARESKCQSTYWRLIGHSVKKILVNKLSNANTDLLFSSKFI